jgi:hypothetical protein
MLAPAPDKMRTQAARRATARGAIATRDARRAIADIMLAPAPDKMRAQRKTRTANAVRV